MENQTIDPNAARKEWLSTLAKAPATTLAAACADIQMPDDFSELRAPEIGGVMVRGRMGASGDAFNMGEVTVTRCAIQLSDGTVGHGYVQGRNVEHSRQAALVDALLQTSRKDEIARKVIDPLKELLSSRHAELQAKADKTKVDFFTMVRGE